MAVNLAKKFSTKVDEKFTREALCAPVLNSDYDFTGVNTVDVYSIPVVDMQNYSRSGLSRYASSVGELQNNVQHLVVEQDRSWAFTIDKGNKLQSMMVMDAGKAVSRQLSLKVIPEFDKYVFETIAKNASHGTTTVPSNTTAYSMLLDAQEVLGNANVPDTGRIALVSYGFGSKLMQDKNFLRDCESAQSSIHKGEIGMVDGLRIIRVPASRLPSGTSFIITHPIATVAPKQLSEYKIHTDAPGISGWLCEGRIIYDAFVLDNKRDAIYYCGTGYTAYDKDTYTKPTPGV